MRLTRHAKNRARFLGASLIEVEQVVESPIQVERDSDGKALYIGYLKGISVRVVVALDEPDLVVTIHETRQ